MFKVKLFFSHVGFPQSRWSHWSVYSWQEDRLGQGGSGTLVGSVTCREGGMPGRAGQECVLWRVHPLLWL